MPIQAASLMLEGVFDRYPKLAWPDRGRFAWVPTLGWRLDKHYGQDEDEVPNLRISRPSICAAISGNDAADRGAGAPEDLSPPASGSAGTAWCSPATIRTGLG